MWFGIKTPALRSDALVRQSVATARGVLRGLTRREKSYRGGRRTAVYNRSVLAAPRHPWRARGERVPGARRAHRAPG